MLWPCALALSSMSETEMTKDEIKKLVQDEVAKALAAAGVGGATTNSGGHGPTVPN